MAEGKPWQEKHCPPGHSRSGGERARGQRWAEQSSSPHGSPEPSCFSEALFRPGPGARAFQAAPKLPPRHRLPQCPGPGKGGEWLGGGGGSPTSWATRLEMRTARLTRPFWALGCRAPVPLAFPAGAAMEDLAPPSLPALEPEGLASAPPAPQQQSQPRLRPRGWRPGAQGRLWHEARVAGAGPRGWGHPGSECGQQPAWLGPPMAPRCGAPAANVLRPARPPAQQQLRGRNLGSSAGPSSQAPTPTPATLGSPALPGLASGPLPRGPIQGSCCSRSRSPRPSPSPRQPGLSPQINGLPDTPAPPVQCPASQTQTDTQRWRDRPVTGKARNTHTHAATYRPKAQTTTRQAQAAGAGAGQTSGAPGGNERQRQEGERGRQPDMGPGVRGNILESRPRGWRPGRDPESQRQREQGQEEGRGGWQRQQQAKGGSSLSRANSRSCRGRRRRGQQRLGLSRCGPGAPTIPGSSPTAGIPTQDPLPQPTPKARI